MRVWLVLVCLLWTSQSWAEPIRVLVSAGQRRGLPEQAVLRHADRDAKRVAEVFIKQGRVKPENAIVVTDATEDKLNAALSKAAAIAAKQAKDQVTLIVYVSAHGDRTRLLLAGKSVTLADLRQRIDSVRAGLRLVITDACRTTEATRAKGVRETPAFSLNVDAPQASGSVWLHASADGEAAQESDKLQGAVFTHFLVSGLRGSADRNRDQQVTLSEAWTYAYHQTLYRTARGSGVVQRPEAEYRLHESTPLVLTYRDAGAAHLSLPAARDTHYLAYATGSKTVQAEVWATPKGATEIALPPGQYLLQRRGAGGAGAVTLTLARGERRELTASQFRPVEVEELAAKGGTLVLRPHAVFVAAGLTTATVHPLVPRLELGASTRLSDLGMTLRLGGAAGRHAPGANDVEVQALDATATLEYVFDLGRAELRAGLGPSALWLREGVRRKDAADLEPLGFDVEDEYRALALGGAAVASARYDVAEVLFLELSASAGALGVKRGSATRPVWRGGAELGAGARF